MIVAVCNRAMRYCRALACLLSLLLVAVPAYGGLLEKAQGCTTEPGRLQRLACFDDVFKTPVAVQGGDYTPRLKSSERWRQAYAQVTGDSRDNRAYRDTGMAAGLLLTLPALGATPPRPLLVLQCHNNITELALMLPQPMNQDTVRVSINGDQSLWRLRDDGYVLSAGRGLPAIALAKVLIPMSQLQLQADSSPLDALLFDLTGFSGAIKPLRDACGW